jgi:hypothetical protein
MGKITIKWALFGKKHYKISLFLEKNTIKSALFGKKQHKSASSKKYPIYFSCKIKGLHLS